MCAQYVTHGAKIKCSCGSTIANLQVLPDRTVILTEGHYANISDHESMVNIPPFGLCRSLKYPPTKSATDANHGSLTPTPCNPGTYSVWQQGNDTYIIRHCPALLTSSYCKCVYGGTITIVDDGQIPGNYEEPKVELLVKAEIVSDSAEERGMDIIDFVPIVGSIRDIGDGIATGSMGLVALGTIFLVADVAGLVGSIFSGGAASVGVTAAKSSIKAGIKVTAKNAAKTIANESAQQAVKHGEKKLLEITAHGVGEGTTKLASEAAEKASKGLNPFNPNLLEGVTTIAETGAKGAPKTTKAANQAMNVTSELRKSAKGALDTATKQIDDISKAGREYLQHGLNQIKQYVNNNRISQFLNELSQASKRIEAAKKDIETLTKITKFLK